MYRFKLAFVLTLIFAQTLFAVEKEEQERLNNLSLQHRLMSGKTTAKDSLQHFFNIFDLSTNNERVVFFDSIMGTAVRSGDVQAQMELIRLYCSFKQQKPLRDKLALMAEALPDTIGKEETVAFTRMRQITYDVRESGSDETERMLQDVLNEVENNLSDNLYERIVQHHKVCVLLGSALQGKVLKKYFSAYLNDIDELPDEVRSLKAAAYIQGCTMFQATEDFKEAKNYNKKVLDLIAELEKYYNEHNRPYRNFVSSKYLRYTSMLTCFEELTPAELNSCYANVLKLSEYSNEVRQYMERTRTPQIYYYYAIGDYKRVVNDILAAIDEPEHDRDRYRLLEMLILSASNIGDHATLDKASRRYISYNRETAVDRSYETYRRLQIRMDIFNIIKDKENLLKEIHNSELEKKNNQIVATSVVLFLLLVIIVLLAIMSRKNRKLNRQLTESNIALQKERDSLKAAKDELIKSKEDYEYENKVKTSFIAGISENVKQPMNAIAINGRLIVDCADNSTKPFLQKFADIIDQNIRILQTIVNDVFTLTELQNSTLQFNYNGVGVNRICSVIANVFRPQLKDGVTFTVTEDGTVENPIITTDAQRVEQILTHLVSNAVKYTDSGNIDLSYRLNKKDKTITFAITDTGCGINAKHAGKIFDRFYKANKHEQGLGIGLSISRMIAEMMGGTLTLDPDYKKGARFLLTIPCV